MENNTLTLNINEILQIANTLVNFFNLKIKVIEFGDNSCNVTCYEKKVYDKITFPMHIVFNEEFAIADIFIGEKHESLIFKKSFEQGENIYSLTVKNCDEEYLYKKQDDGSFVKYIKENKYIDSDKKTKSNFKCKNNCIKRELF